ncbi:hypothetical protein MAE02_14710 [Microvirga aerophila]|uniref:Uncharacterized protein n=1 Tax=Microvirga aerophila TaxID=670291 RepID=A0A512BPB5_9HYPH|nr:hypothetical protein MAE02_14710 [Microvirga aerophila]
MTPIPLSLSRLIALSIQALFWVGTAVAQAPDQQSPPNRPTLRQPTLSSVQQQEGLQAGADQSRSEADRKMREMERRLNRTLRSVCSVC